MPKLVVHAPVGPHLVGWRQRLAIYIWLGWVLNYLVYLSTLAVLLALGRWWLALVWSSPWILLCVYPGLSREEPAWGHALGGWIMRRAREYFHLTVVLEDADALEKAMHAGPCVIGLEPHDILPFSIFAVSKYISLVPGTEQLGMMTGVLFRLPGMRQVYTWCSAGSVDKKPFVQALRRGATCCVIPGGVQEVLALAPGEREQGVCKLYLKRRKGFVKLALAHGAPLVPAFCFGLEATMDASFPRGKIWEKIARKIGFLPLVYWGSPSWLPFTPPRPAPLTVVFGAPIQVPPPPEDRATVDDKTLDDYHARFVEAILALHMRHKKQYGLPTAAVSII